MPKGKQPSRKTKSTWRKNIDLTGVEARLDNERAAERVGMAPVDTKTASGALFVVDRQGDEHLVKGKKAGKRPLTSLAILNKKDVGAPAVLGRARKGVDHAAGSAARKQKISRSSAKGGAQGGLTPEERATRSGISRSEIERLRRATGRDVRGAFGIIKEQEDDDPNGAHRGGPEALIGDAYDVWSAADQPAQTNDEEADGEKKAKPRAPTTFAQVRTTDVSLPLPDEGQSYNPAAAAHEALLNSALREAMQDESKRQALQEYSRKWKEGAASTRAETSRGAVSDVQAIEAILGMRVGTGDDAEESEEEVSSDEKDGEGAEEDAEATLSTANKKKMPKRKTKQQRTRAKRVKEEERARLAAKAERQAKAQVFKLRAIKRQLAELDEENAVNALRRSKARQQHAEQHVGLRKLPQPDKEVQLGEDLSESLRGLKPEGNLLRDRVHAFQKRGLLEPRRTTTLSSKQKGATRKQKEYERHAYKRFL